MSQITFKIDGFQGVYALKIFKYRHLLLGFNWRKMESKSTIIVIQTSKLFREKENSGNVLQCIERLIKAGDSYLSS